MENCLHTNFTIDESRAEMICEDCGFLTEQINVHRETEFEELNNGRIAAIGQIIYTGENATKQNTISKASARINDLCAKLGLSEKLASYSLGIYKTALGLGMTRGRNASVTVGACVYLASRVKKQSLMLLDVSDKVNVNVYVLGKTYNELKEKTNQKVIDIDPCLFINRFAMELELGDKTNAVTITALKLLQRMKKDWISTGRRPAAVTSAALVIAARMHGFDRDCSDGARIAGVSKQTTKKRIHEWSQTPTADLTIDEFDKVEFEDENNPPAFNTEKLEESVIKMSDEELEKVKNEVINLKNKLEEELVSKKGEKLDKTYYQKIVDSVETGELDVEALIGALGNDDEDEGDNNEDKLVEMEGRRELLGECLGMREAFMALKKKELVVEEAEASAAVKDQLPVFLPELEDDRYDGEWTYEGTGLEEIDDDELERVYICSEEESVMKAMFWYKNNKKYYSDMKKSRERKALKRRATDTETGKKNRPKKQKRNYAYGVDPEELLRDMKERRLTATVHTNNYKGEQQEEERDEPYKNEDRDDKEGDNDDEAVSHVSDYSVQYDYNEDD